MHHCAQLQQFVLLVFEKVLLCNQVGLRVRRSCLPFKPRLLSVFPTISDCMQFSAVLGNEPNLEHAKQALLPLSYSLRAGGGGLELRLSLNLRSFCLSFLSASIQVYTTLSAFLKQLLTNSYRVFKVMFIFVWYCVHLNVNHVCAAVHVWT